MKKSSVLIIGGGASGLMAANILSSEYEVTLLEAAPGLGSRIKTVYLADDQVVEAGADFIHGHLLLTMQLFPSSFQWAS